MGEGSSPGVAGLRAPYATNRFRSSCLRAGGKLAQNDANAALKSHPTRASGATSTDGATT